MMKLVVLCCVVAAVAANVPYYVAPAPIGVPSFIGYGLPLQQPYNTAHLAIRTLDNGVHALKKRSAPRLAVAPGPVGLATPVAEGNFGISSPITNYPIGFSAAIATNPIGISAATNRLIGLSTPIVAGSAGVSVPFAGVTSPFNPISFPGPIAVSAPTFTGSALNTSPVAVGSFGVSGSAVPVIGNF